MKIRTVIDYQRPVPALFHPRRFVFRIVAALIALSVSSVTPALGEIYHFVADDGTAHFSDQPSDSRFRLLLSRGSDGTASPGLKTLSPELFEIRGRLSREISAAALASQIDVSLLKAVIEIESGYNANAASPKGALGLMQLMPGTARRYGVTNPLDPVQNLRGGANHLRDLLAQFSNDKELALAAYNAGAGAVMAHGRRIPPYLETARYVPAVLQRYERLRKEALTFTN